MANPEQQDVLATPSVLECPICNEQYGTEYDTTPRVLRCGHTYCTKCLAQLVSIHAGKRYGVKCAFCSSLHELSRPDPKLIPVNHAVLEIIKISDSKRVDTKVVGPQCEYKGLHCEEGATWVCFDCNPTKNNTLFCSMCIKTEHNRGFEPVTRHRRMLMTEVNNPHAAYCLYHPRILATLYSIKFQQFACSECESSRPEFADMRDQFEPINDAVQTLRSQAKRMVKYSQGILAKLNVALGSISANNAELGPTVEQTKNQIQQKFSEIREIIQERQMTLMKHVQAEYSDRKQGMEDQLTRIKAAFNDISAAQGSLNSVLGKHDVDFLVHYLLVFQGMERVLSEEDRSLQRTVSYKDIPFYIPLSIMEDLRKLGAVGGGTVPQEIEVELSSVYSNLLQLKWQLPHYATDVQWYEIEYENLPNTGETALKVSQTQSSSYFDSEPQSIMVPGNVLASYIQDICPGYKYRFRIRSQNVAGWGMWSKSVVAKCDSFPTWIKGMRRIHRIRIPTDGYYRLTAKGAKGADGKVHYGGRGAIISGSFPLKSGDVLIVLVGTMSTMSVCNTGGGGGSFVAVNEISQSNLLIAAGGGGGTRGLEERDEDGCDANLETWGTDGVGKEHGKGGTGGTPGEDANSDGFSGPCWGYGGAGFMQNSSSARSFFEGGMGGQYGGFGGGGAVGLYGGGGGGGYSGGGGGRGGGGGGSYVRDDALNVRRVVGNESHGEVEIKVVDPPSQILNMWSEDSHMNTNAAPMTITSGDAGVLGGEFVTQCASSDGQSLMMSQASSTAARNQATAAPLLPCQPLPAPSQTHENPLMHAYLMQLSKASSGSNTSSSLGVTQYNDYPQLSEVPIDATQQLVTAPDVASEGQLRLREDNIPVVEEAVMQQDVACPLGRLQHQPELIKFEAVTLLPPLDTNASASCGTNYLPQQPQAAAPYQKGSDSNASSDLSPAQTINTHPGSNANAGTT